jgi:Tfp pilus assembly protein PilO
VATPGIIDWSIRGIAFVSLGLPAAVVFCALHTPWKNHDDLAHAGPRGLEVVHDKLAEAHAELLRTEDELRQSRSRAQLVQQRIPDVPSEDEFLRQLTEVADATGLKILDYRPGTRMIKETYAQLRIELRCTAAYPALCAFLDQLREIPRVFTVEKMTIEARPAGEEYPLNLNLSVYFRRNQPSPEEQKQSSNG